jgi:hypothetical protein
LCSKKRYSDSWPYPLVVVAVGLDEQVAVGVETVADGRADYLVTCGWNAEE